MEKTNLIEALRAVRNAAEAAGEDKIADRAALDIARLRREAKKAESAVTVEVEPPKPK